MPFQCVTRFESLHSCVNANLPACARVSQAPEAAFLNSLKSMHPARIINPEHKQSGYRSVTAEFMKAGAQHAMP